MEECRRFLNEFGQRSCASSEDEIIQYRNSGCYITENDLEGEITDWALQYLHVNKCPHNLAPVLARETCDELLKDSLENCCESIQGNFDKHNSANGDTKEIIRVFNPRKLLRTVHLKVHDVCKKWMDKDMNFLEKWSRPVSVSAIKNSRRRMEDRHLAIPDLNIFGLKNEESHGFYAIYDGHAGAEAATYASAHLHLNIVSHPAFSQNLELAIREGFQKTEQDFLDKSNREGLKSGTTVLCAFVDPHKITVAWLGDSQAFVVRNGLPIYMVTPHKPDRADEKHRIESLGGNVVLFGTWRVNGVLAVSRAIGDAEHKPYIISEPEISSLDLEGTEDFLILACDGLWDVMSAEDATSIVYSHLVTTPEDLEGISQKLVHIAVQQGSNDNITVQVVFLRNIKDIISSCPQVQPVHLHSVSSHPGNTVSITEDSESSPIESSQNFDLVKNKYNIEISAQNSPANLLIDNSSPKPEVESPLQFDSFEAQGMLSSSEQMTHNGINGKTYSEDCVHEINPTQTNLWISSEESQLIQHVQEECISVESVVINSEKTSSSQQKINVQADKNENAQDIQEYFLAPLKEHANFLDADVKPEVEHEIQLTNSSLLLSFDSKPYQSPERTDMSDPFLIPETPETEKADSPMSSMDDFIINKPTNTGDTSNADLSENDKELILLMEENDTANMSTSDKGELLPTDEADVLNSSISDKEIILPTDDLIPSNMQSDTNVLSEIDTVLTSEISADETETVSELLSLNTSSDAILSQVETVNLIPHEMQCQEADDRQLLSEVTEEVPSENRELEIGLLVKESDELDLTLEQDTSVNANNLPPLDVKHIVENLNDVKEMIQSEPLSLEHITVEKIPESLPVADDVVDDESEDGDGWRFYHPDSISSESGKIKTDQSTISSSDVEIAPAAIVLNDSTIVDQNEQSLTSDLVVSDLVTNHIENLIPKEPAVVPEPLRDAKELNLDTDNANKETGQPETLTPDENAEKLDEAQVPKANLIDHLVSTEQIDVVPEPEITAVSENVVVKSSKTAAKPLTSSKNAAKTITEKPTLKSSTPVGKTIDRKTDSSKHVASAQKSSVGTIRNATSAKTATKVSSETTTRPPRTGTISQQRTRPIPKTETRVNSADSKVSSSGTLPKRSVIPPPAKSSTMRTAPKPKVTEAKTTTIKKVTEKPLSNMQSNTLKTTTLNDRTANAPLKRPIASGTLRPTTQLKGSPKTSVALSTSSKHTKDTLNKKISSSTKQSTDISHVDNAVSKDEVPKSKSLVNATKTETKRMTSTPLTRKVEMTTTKSKVTKEQIKDGKTETTSSGTIKKLPSRSSLGTQKKLTRPSIDPNLKSKVKNEATKNSPSASNTLRAKKEVIGVSPPKEKLNSSLSCSEKGSLDESTKETSGLTDQLLLAGLCSGDCAQIEEKIDLVHQEECSAGGDHLPPSPAVQ